MILLHNKETMFPSKQTGMKDIKDENFKDEGEWDGGDESLQEDKGNQTEQFRGKTTLLDILFLWHDCHSSRRRLCDTSLSLSSLLD